MDLGTRIIAPSPIVLPRDLKTGYSAVWDGRWSWFSEDYTFFVVGSGEATLTVAGQSLPAPVPPTPVASSCGHDLCAIGDKLAPTTGTVPACHPCVDQVCAKDPYCCNGGYLSYYSSEPVWDAKCVAEVGELCANPKISCTTPIPGGLAAAEDGADPAAGGRHYPIRLTYKNVTGDDTLRLLWSSARQHKGRRPALRALPGRPGCSAEGGLDVRWSRPS